MKRGNSEYSLILGVAKESGMSSHDVVNRIRSIYGEKRVGHLGTLDPLATGVLPVCVGPATRIMPYFHEHTKIYRFGISFGYSTDTDDEAGMIIERKECPEELLLVDKANETVKNFLGEQMQLPPVYSAKKVGGLKSCDVARKGTVLSLEPKKVDIKAIDVLAIQKSDDGIIWDCEACVSTGTYIRSLARDIGKAVGCPAHVSHIARMTAGPITIDSCKSLESIEQNLACAIIDPVRLLGYPSFNVDSLQSIVQNGNPIPLESILREGAETPIDELHENDCVCLCVGDTLKAIYHKGPAANLLPSCVFAKGISRR